MRWYSLNAAEKRCKVARSFNAGGKVIVGVAFSAAGGTFPNRPGRVSPMLTLPSPPRPSVEGGKVVKTAVLPYSFSAASGTDATAVSAMPAATGARVALPARLAMKAAPAAFTAPLRASMRKAWLVTTPARADSNTPSVPRTLLWRMAAPMSPVSAAPATLCNCATRIACVSVSKPRCQTSPINGGFFFSTAACCRACALLACTAFS